MVSSNILIINLAISIAIILFLILKFKLNPAISLVIGALFMGIASGMPMTDTLSGIGKGFGGLMGAIGLPIGFGVILGQLLSDSGGARTIATTMVAKTSPKNAIYAIGFTAFLLSIPVFYDVTFVIIIPLGIALAKESRMPMPYIIGSMVIGAGTAHTLVPPTPNPMAAASIFNFDLGVMVGFGGIVGLIVAFIAMKIFFFILDKGLWNAAKDETGIEIVHEENVPAENRPSFLLSVIPIALPIILILLGTISKALMNEVPMVIQFLSNRIIALLAGVLAAYLMASRFMESEAIEKSAATATKAAGIVLLITGAGGAFGKVIQMTDIGNVLVQHISHTANAGIVTILITYFIAMVFRIAQGSGTVAAITTMTLMATVVQGVDIHPVWVALAALSGGLSIGHVNDSGFWVTANLSGLSVTGGLKTYTLGGAIVSLLTLLAACLGALFFPMI
ncbi:MAG: GntP family permease [Pseudodesulfovibrio sp.]